MEGFVDTLSTLAPLMVFVEPLASFKHLGSIDGLVDTFSSLDLDTLASLDLDTLASLDLETLASFKLLQVFHKGDQMSLAAVKAL